MAKGSDLGTLRDAVTIFRETAMGQAAQVEQAAVSPAGLREVEAEGWQQPVWAPPGRFRADSRLLAAGEPVLRRTLSGWVAPDLEAVAAVEISDRELENELYRARAAFIEQAAAVAVEFACFGAVYPRRLDDGGHWRHVAPGDFPEQAHELVPAAQAALSRWALVWLSAASMVEGAAFLPRGRRSAR